MNGVSLHTRIYMHILISVVYNGIQIDVLSANLVLSAGIGTGQIHHSHRSILRN